MPASFQDFLAAWATSEFRQHELHVLTGAQRVGGKVRARTKIIAPRQTTNGNAVLRAFLRISDAKLAKYRLRPQIFSAKTLSTTKVTAQRRLPRIQIHVERLAMRRQHNTSSKAWAFGHGAGWWNTAPRIQCGITLRRVYSAVPVAFPNPASIV
jgi:hypothetical protein